jgi:CubicO group peptidase (beta-lactamase class C family)
VTALDALAAWPVPHAAGAVVPAGGGTTEQAGETDRPFPLASVTKLVTALAVLVACEEETVALDEPAGPEGSTVRHLLAHASGLGVDDRVAARPGERRIYSNTGFEILGEVVAARAGIAFGRYATEAVLDPLGMGSTSMDGSPAHGATSTVADLTRFAAELLSPTLVAPATLAEAVDARRISVR